MNPMFPRRSSLSVPGNNNKMMAKAAGSAADVVVLDLEDAVPPAEKETARERVREALAELDFGGKEVAVRVNGLTTTWAEQDLVMAAEAGADAVVVPKAEDAEGLAEAARVLGRVEAEARHGKTVSMQLLIESAAGVQRVDELAGAGDRITALIFGIGDYLADLGIRVLNLGETEAVCLYPRSRIAVAAAAQGIEAIDSVYPDFKDLDGLAGDARRGLLLGFKGKWVIHPAQIETVNAVFTPGPEELKQARTVVEAYEKAKAEGVGAIMVAGRMVDEASVRLALKQCELARRLGLWES